MKRTQKRPSAKNNKTQKSHPRITNKMKATLVTRFLELLNLVKLYHWKTRVYSQHQATDQLYQRLGENIDQFVEVLLGKDESRVRMVHRSMRLLDSVDKSDFKNQIYEYRDFLIGLNRIFDAKKDTDLLNIRDEILGDINQFLYLMTFDVYR